MKVDEDDLLVAMTILLKQMRLTARPMSRLRL